MKFIAPKAAGTSDLGASPARSGMSVVDFAERFAAKPIHRLGDDTNPFSTVQLATELQARLASLSATPAPNH